MTLARCILRSSITGAALLAVSGVALAHVSLPAGGGNVNALYEAAFHVGHACKDAKSTTTIEVELPGSFQFREAVARPGWKLSAPAAGSQGGTVRWTAENPSTALPDAEKALFVVRGVLPGTPQTLYFPVHQICDVNRADWTQIPTAADAGQKLTSPAARLEVLADSVAPVDIQDAWVRAAVTGQSGTGAFMTLQAPAGAKLVAASSPAAGIVEIHEMKLEGDVMRMRAMKQLDLPAAQKVTLAPGAMHLMMMDLKQPITAGQSIAFTLTFEDANGKRRERTVQAQVRQGVAAQAAPHGGQHHH